MSTNAPPPRAVQLESEPLEPAASVEAAWSAAIAGGPGAERAIRHAVAEVRGAARRTIEEAKAGLPPRARPPQRYALVDRGERIAISGPRQLAIVDARTLAPLAMIRAPADYQRPEPLPASSLFLVRSGDTLSVYDTRGLGLVASFGHAPVVVSPDGASLVIFEQPLTLRLWDVTTRGERWRTLVDVLSPYQPKDAVFADAGRVVVVRDPGGAPIMTLETATARPIVAPAYGGGQPTFSADGRLIANVALDEEGSRVVRLLDRVTGATVATSASCAQPFATAFDHAGKLLAVGGANSVCVLHVPSLRLWGRIPALGRATKGTGWDLVTPTFVAGGKAIFAERRDGAALMIDAATMTPLWKGNGHLANLGPITAVYDTGTTLREIDAKGRVTTREVTRDELLDLTSHAERASAPPDLETRSRLKTAFCILDDWLLPTSTCE